MLDQLGKFRGGDKARARDREIFLERQCCGRVAEVACWDCCDWHRLLATAQGAENRNENSRFLQRCNVPDTVVAVSCPVLRFSNRQSP